VECRLKLWFHGEGSCIECVKFYSKHRGTWCSVIASVLRNFRLPNLLSVVEVLPAHVYVHSCTFGRCRQNPKWRSFLYPSRSLERLQNLMFFWRKRMTFTILLVPEIYVSGSFADTHQNFCQSISEILGAHLYPLLERQNYSNFSLACFWVLGGRCLLFTWNNLKVT
jgi:hypothetical protein